MKNDRDTVDRFLRNLTPPAIPPELRDRALDDAHRALVSESRPDLWTRIWESRSIRLAWSLAVALLLAAHAALPLAPKVSNAAASRPRAPQRRPDADLLAIAHVPRISEEALHLVSTSLDLPSREVTPSAKPPRRERKRENAS